MTSTPRYCLSLLALLTVAELGQALDRGRGNSSSSPARPAASAPAPQARPAPAPAPSRPSAGAGWSSGGSRGSGSGSSTGSAGWQGGSSRGTSSSGGTSSPWSGGSGASRGNSGGGYGGLDSATPAPWSRGSAGTSSSGSSSPDRRLPRGGASSDTYAPGPDAGSRSAREVGEPVRWRPGDPDRAAPSARRAEDAGTRAGRTSYAPSSDDSASGLGRAGANGANDGRYSERVYASDDLVWRTRETAAAPVPRLAGSSSLPVDTGVERALSRARLERANGNAPLVGGMGAIAGPGARLGAVGGGRVAPAGAASTSQPVDNARILERYQPSAHDRATRGEATQAPTRSLADKRGARARYAGSEGKRAEVAKADEGAGSARKLVAGETADAGRTSRKDLAAESGRARRGSQDGGAGEARRRAAAKEVEGLRRVDPAAAVLVERRSQGLAEAARVSTRIAAGVAVGSWTGCSTGWWWSDSWNDCGWYKPWWTWHMSWSQCWGGGYGFGFGWGWNSSWWRPSCWSPCYGWSYPSWYWYPSVVWIDRDEPLVVERVVEREVVRETLVESEAPPVVVAADARVAEPAAPEVVVQALHAAARQHLDEGDRAFLEGRYADAVHHYARAVECSQEDGALHLVLADALFATGDYHYCAWSLRRAHELDPTLFDAQVDKRGFYSDAAEFERQIALAEGFLEDHFLDDDARLVLAANYHWAGRHGDCVELLESAFSVGVRESACGARILARAREAAAVR